MSIHAECLERFIDPKTKEQRAMLGWLQRGAGLPDQYFVIIEDRPALFFTHEQAAREFYSAEIQLLKSHLRIRGPYRKTVARAALVGK